MGWRSWRFVHLFAYASWPIAVIHGLGTGSDTKSIWALLLVAVCVLAVVAAIVWRLAQAGPRFTALRLLGITGSVAATGLLVVWMAAGPLQHGWAKSAGTPADLLAGIGATPASTAAPVAALAAGMNDQLIGRLVRSGALVCQAAASIGNTSVTARCGSVLASVQVVDQGNGSIGGTLTTQKQSA
jgi:hypothetical protein